jgi:hypothetical protein
MSNTLKVISEIGIISLFINNPILRVILGLIVIGLVIAGIVKYYRRSNHTTTTTMPTMPTQIPAGLQNTNQAIENFAAISDADYQKIMTSAGDFTLDQKRTMLDKLGCQNAVDQNMQGYRSAESGATFKVEEVQKLGASAKYIVHAADNLVISVDNVTGRLSRVIKNTSAEPQLFDREPVMGADGKTATGAVMFTKILASKVKFALQYEHEALSLRPLDTSVTPARPWRGQQFVLDVNLKGALLDAAAFSLGYKLTPGIGPQDLQNVGVASANGGTGSSNIPIATAAASGDLGALTKAQLDTALSAAVANINAFNRTSAGAQPGTLDNPFANKPLKINLNLAGLGGNPTQPNPISGLVSGFADIPKSGMTTESFADMATNTGTGQIRGLIQAWDAAQNPGSENDLGGFPAAAGTLGNALRGKMLSCPKLDRTQYYTERQLSQCAGCTPDPYLRGQLGGQVYV